jgi:rhodanese-related sulfurtransferase
MLSRKKSFLLLVIVLITIATSIVVYYNLSQPDNRYEDITVDQAKALIETTPSLVIVDVRTESEFFTERIEGAINIPLDVLQQRLAELKFIDTMLIYCRTGNRSTQAANILIENGFSDFYHMQGGIVTWKENGYPVIPQ